MRIRTRVTFPAPKCPMPRAARLLEIHALAKRSPLQHEFRRIRHHLCFSTNMTIQTSQSLREQEVEIPAGSRRLYGILNVPRNARGVVVFAHGSGSGRLSPRNQFVARLLQEGGLATLLIDLLEEAEAEDRDKVFDIELLAHRLRCAADWLHGATVTAALRLGYFGASTGAGAALKAAALAPAEVKAVVSRGGRPDLARDCLSAVRAPTLLIVGGDDAVLQLNEQALRLLRRPRDLVVIPGATHLFPEPGALEEVARLAKDWFVRYLDASPPDNTPVRR